MRFQCSSCQLVIKIDENECGCTIGCGKCGEIIEAPEGRFGSSAVFGDYVIDKKIRQGADGTDYFAHHLETNQQVSIKIMNSEYAADPSFRTRFISAARQLASLDHPNLVTIFTAGLEEQILFMARQLVDGEPLADRLGRDGTVQPGIGEKILIQTSMALQYAWERAQLLHTNIKPDNILLETSGAVKLADVGIVQLTLGSDDEIKGTPQFMAPEVIVGEEVDLRTDLYNLACVVFHAVSGQFPFAGDSPRAILEGHLNDPIPSLAEVCPGVSENLDRTLRCLMAKELDDRLANVDEIKRSLAGEIVREPEVVEDVGSAVAEVSPEDSMAAAAAKKKKKKGAKRIQKRGATRMVKALGDSTATAGTRTQVAGGTRTTTAMRSSNPDDRMKAAMAARPKRSKAPFIVLGILVAAVAITVTVLYRNYIPSSLAKFEGIYLSRFAPKQEQMDFAKVRKYLGKAALNSSDLAYLEGAATELYGFYQAHPNSIYCLPADRIDYKAVFGLPDFLMKKHMIFGPQVAGTVPMNLAEYDEFIARERREEMRDIEEDAVETHREEVAKQRRKEELARQEQERRDRELELKNERLTQLLERRNQLIPEVLEATKDHDYDHAISLVKPLSAETDPMFGEIRQWSLDKVKSLEAARDGYRKILDSGLTLRGEKIVLMIAGKPKKVEVRTFSRTELTVKYSELAPDPKTGKYGTQIRDLKLPLAKIPFKELEVLGRLAIERNKLSGDFFGYLGLYHYYAGDTGRARQFLSRSSSEGVAFVLAEMSGDTGGAPF
jgi:hypothetical protein